MHQYEKYIKKKYYTQNMSYILQKKYIFENVIFN